MSADQEATLCGGLNDRFCRSTVEIRRGFNSPVQQAVDDQ